MYNVKTSRDRNTTQCEHQPPVQRSECFQLGGDGLGSSVTGTDCGNLARADKLHSAQEEVFFSKTNATGEEGVSTLKAH